MPQKNHDLTVFFIAGTLFVFLLVIFILTYIYLHQLKVNKFKIHIRDQELSKQQELFIALNEGEEKERKRVTEELHDGIGAKLSGIKMSIEFLKSNPTNNDMIWNKISLEINETIIELREISQNMTPSFLTSHGLSSAIRNLISYFNNKGKCTYRLYIEDGITQDKIMNVYRIVSELLNNIHKHSEATLASIQITNIDSGTLITVEDNGIGFNEEERNGNGLKNIHNRIKLYNGKIHTDSSSKGTCFIIELPSKI